MLQLGEFQTKNCGGWSRRSFLSLGASLPFAGLASQLQASTEYDAPKAKSVIMVWLWGGPSHIDTFDPKPNASDNYRGPFAPISTKVPGVQFSELVPKLAQRLDKFAVVRSTRFSAGHDMLPLTGGRRSNSGQLEPNFGSILAKRREAEGLPPFISVAPLTELSHGFDVTRKDGYGAGRFGAAYNPFIVRCSSEGKLDIAALKLLNDVSIERLNDRLTLQYELDQLQRGVETTQTEKWSKELRNAYSLLTESGASRAFDLSDEKDSTRGRYGRTPFGQSLLMGRRLVEAGVPYVQVNWSHGVDGLQEGSNMGWDTHRNGFGQLMNYHCPIFDRAFSALLDDLDERGLLDSTLVVATGEMGRTPKINNTGGRDHWATCSTLWAGGGVRGGRVIGKTDAIGGQPVTEPVTALHAGTTIAEQAGIHAQLRAELGVLQGGEVIKDLL